MMMMMMMNKCSSYRSCDHNNYEQQQKNVYDHSNDWSLANDDQKKNIGYSSISRRMFKCDMCHRIFTSGSALGGHKSHHYRSVQPLAKKHKHDVLDYHRKQNHACHDHDYDNVFSSNKGLKGIESPTTSSLEQQSNMCDDDDQFQVGGAAPPTIDLSKYLPQRSYETKKRSIRRRNMIDHELVNAATILIHMSRAAAVVAGDRGHTPKRLKLSSNAAVNDKMQNQDSGYIDETPVTKVKKGINNSEKNLVLRFKIHPSSSEDNNIWNCNQHASNDIDETPETKVKDNDIKKSLVLRFKIPHSSSKDNNILQTSEDCSQHGSIDIEDKKKNNEGGETGREQSHNELKSKRVVRNFDLNELPMEDDVADE